MADYYINSDKGKELANSLRAGDMAEASDGSTWRKEADGSITVTKNGQTMTGRVGVSAPAVSETASSGSTSVSTPVLEESQSQQSSPLQTETQLQTTELEKAQGQQTAQKTEELSASEKAKEATSNVTAGLGQSMSDDLLNQAIQQAMKPETYTIGSAKGVLMTEKMQKAGDMAEAADGSLWKRNEDGSITVTKDGKTYTANVDRAAAKQDPQWAVLTAPPEDTTDDTSSKKSKKKSSGSSSGASAGGGNYYATVPQTATEETTVQQAATADRATLRKQAATAQKEMGDLARQISVAKIRGKDTSDLQAKYNEAKARYDSATTQINAPQKLTTTAARKEAAAEKNAAAHENASAQAAERKDAWKSLPTVRDSERFSGIDNVTTGRMRSAEQQQIAGAVKELQKDAWRSLPTIQDSDRFSIPSQTDSLMQQAIAKTPRTLSGKPYLPENDGGFSHSSGSTERQNVLERIGNAALGGLIQSGGTSMDATGAMYQAGQGGRNTTYNESRAWFQDQLDSELRTLNSMLLENQDNPGTYTQAEIKNQRRIVAEAQARVNAFALTQDAQEQSGELARDLAADVSNAGASRVAQSKRGASKLGSMALDALASAAQSGADMATNALLGTSGSMLPFAFRAFGGGTQQAQNDGATLGQQLAYGGTMAAKEVFTEKMFNIAGLQSKAYGKGSFDDYVEKAVAGAVDKLASTDFGKRLLGGAAQFMTSAAGEGLEELIGDWMEWQLPRIYGKDPDSAKDVAVNSLYDFLVGAISGVMGNLTTPGQFTNYDINEHLGGSQGQQVNRQLTQDELFDAAMQAAMRGETFTEPLQAANQNTKQTTQATQELGAGDVITVGEINKNSAAPEQTTVSPINGPVRSDAAEAGTININYGAEKIKSEFKKLIEKNKGYLSFNQLIDYGNSLSKADAQSLISFMDDIESGRTPYKYDAAGGIHKVDPDTHIDKRDMSMRMKRGQHSFQYDNPEVHEYMKQAAEMLLEEINNSTRGERFATPVENTVGGSAGGYDWNSVGGFYWTGVKRHTTEGIAYLKDNFGISWDNLARAAENIIKDEGAENYADANRVEMLLDDMLTHGYRSLSNQNEFHSYYIPPNEAYIAAKSAIPGASKQSKQDSAMDLLFEEMDNTESARKTPETVAQSSNPVNQNVSATDSTGAAPAGFDPLSHASNQYGAIPPGEKASRVVDIPASMDGETKVRRFTRTAAEAQVTTDEMVNRIENLVADGKLDYEVYGNKQALQDGRKLIEKQYTRGKTIEQIRSDFIRDANNGKGGAKFVSQGTMLYADAIAAGDYQTASDILVALAAVETNAGQTVQAARLLKSMSPEGRIFTVQKMVSNLEAQINQRRSGNKQIEINVPDALLNAYQNATTETAQQTALDNIYQNIADQVPTTLREGLQQWRYFSMLANPSTHAKNITGNVSGAVAKIGKDNIGALLETIFIGDKPGYRTKAFLNLASEADQNLLNKAWADYDTASELFEDSVGKYSQSSGEINDRRRYWKINDPKNAVTKEIDKALGAAEKVADFNTKALEVEDMWFSKPMYATALASYMKANHLTEVTDAARTYAMTEAKRGTYNDLNAVSKWASQIGNNSKIGRFLAGVIYPFKKVPANVMVRTVEYSPIGFAKGVYDLIQMGKGNTDYTAAKAIDDFAAGVTGTALLGLGAMLAKHGLLRATGIGDDEEKEQQKNAFGAKDFSILVGDTYIPIDSFTINGTGLLTGAQIWEAVQNAKNGDEPVSLEDILDALSKITDPVFEQSMLTGLDSVIRTIQKSDNTGNGEMAAKLAIQIIGNYIGQYVPTLLGRIASSTDKNQRSTYIEPDGPWDPVQSAIQGVQKKVPGWRQQMAVTYGNWGVPVEGNGAGSTASAIGKAVTPIYPSQKKTDPVEEEIARLHDADSAYANFYKRPSKTISVDGKSVKLTSEQYGNYVVARGQTDYNLRSAMLENDLYKSLPDQIKSKAMEMSQAYATEIGREAAGVGYQSQEKWVNDLAGKSQDDVLNAVLLRAVESSGYISPETQAQLTKVEQQFGGADYVGLSDELFNSAKEKANTYFSAVEAAKYGGELTETQKELADKDSKDLARYFMDKAIESRYSDTNKSGTKADEYLKAYRHGELNDAMALAVLSDKEVMAYDRFGRSAKVTPEMALQAANAHAGMKDVKDEDGNVTSSAQDQFDAWLGKQSWTDDQKSAVRMGFYSDNVKTYSYLADQLRKGNIKTSDAKSELTTSYQAGWSKNVRDTGVKMADYIDAIVEYEDRPSEEERKAAGYKNTWTWFCDYLNTTDLTQEQKFGIAISMSDYSDKTKQKIWAALR